MRPGSGILALFVLLPAVVALGADPEAFRPPLMKDFIGLNVHTVQFKPELYAPVCRLLRDYHPMDWDTTRDTSKPTQFPFAANRVDWSKLYGGWTQKGYEVDACVMFEGGIKPGQWKDAARDARAYGETFARFFGPSGEHPWVTSVEIGNEPHEYTAEQYREVFENMARGLRAGDPKMKILTAAVMTGKPDKWSKPVSAIEGLNDLYDVLNVHSYAMKEQWPTWRRSYPEDPSIPYLKSVESLIEWRDRNAPGKQVWLTEFGYDASTKPPPRTGDFKQWVGVTDEQQAQYNVRTFLVVSSMRVERAYLYFFNDKDEPQLHGSSGITRDFKPKPAFHAMAHLYKTLGDYRFTKAVVRDGALYCFEYARDGKRDDRVYVAWSPTAGVKPATRTLPIAGRGVTKTQRMPLSAEDAAAVDWKQVGDGIELEIGESPVFIRTAAR
jgi:serine/threonine-protein kinase ATR